MDPPLQRSTSVPPADESVLQVKKESSTNLLDELISTTTSTPSRTQRASSEGAPAVFTRAAPLSDIAKFAGRRRRAATPAPATGRAPNTRRQSSVFRASLSGRASTRTRSVSAAAAAALSGSVPRRTRARSSAPRLPSRSSLLSDHSATGLRYPSPLVEARRRTPRVAPNPLRAQTIDLLDDETDSDQSDDTVSTFQGKGNVRAEEMESEIEFADGHSSVDGDDNVAEQAPVAKRKHRQAVERRAAAGRRARIQGQTITMLTTVFVEGVPRFNTRTNYPNVRLDDEAMININRAFVTQTEKLHAAMEKLPKSHS